MAALTFTLIQSDLHWEDKARNLAMFEEKIKSIQEKKQVVILPETFNTGFSMDPNRLGETMNGDTVAWMVRVAKEHKIILVGSIMIQEKFKNYNRLLWVLPSGEIQHYDKRHLFSLGGEQDQFSSGERRVIVQVNGWRILLQICYDLRFPVYARQQKDDEYDAILFVANWPQKRIDAWNTLLKARAIENQCYTIGVNRIGEDVTELVHNGCSSIYDPLGETIYYKENTEDIFTTTLDTELVQMIRKKLPFQQDRDSFSL
jgi:predicted amidohydrolase